MLSILQCYREMGDDDWKRKKGRKEKSDDHEKGKEVKQKFVDRIFRLLEGPIATTLVKLVATGMICATTVLLTGILAFSSAPTSIVLTAIGLGLLTTGLIWIFGGWRKQAKACSENRNHKKKSELLQSKLAELEERLANVEIIESFEDRLATRVTESRERDRVGETVYGSNELNQES